MMTIQTHQTHYKHHTTLHAHHDQEKLVVMMSAPKKLWESGKVSRHSSQILCEFVFFCHVSNHAVCLYVNMFVFPSFCNIDNHWMLLTFNLWEFILLQQLLLLFPFLGFAACFSPFLSFFPCLFPLCTISNHPMRHRACCCCCGITSQHLTLSCPGNTSQKPLLPQPSPLPSHYYFTKTLDYLIISFWISLSVTTLKIWVPLVCKGTYHN